MSDIFTSAWFYWAIGIAVGLPFGLVLLTEWQHLLGRKNSPLARPVALLRNYLLPLGALLLMMVEATQMPPEATSVRMVGTLVAFVVLVLTLSGINAALFQSAPDGTWRKRIPGIFLDVARFVVIAIGLALIFAYIWDVKIGGLFTALGVTSIVVGLTLQNSVGQIISGLLMLFEQPFRLGDWIETPTAKGRVVELNWRAVHLETAAGLQITPNSVLAGSSLANLSRLPGKHTLTVTSVFAVEDPPDRVCAMLKRVASELAQCDPGRTPSAVTSGGLNYQTTIPLRSPADDPKAKATFLRWIWYASRREGLHLDEADDDFASPERVADAVAAVVAPWLRLSPAEQQELVRQSALQRYAAGELIQSSGKVPEAVEFIVSGEVQLTAISYDGREVQVAILEEGSFLGQSCLTREPVIGFAYALDEVTVVTIGREQIADVLHRSPLLLEEFGRAIEQRRHRALRAMAASQDDDAED